MCSVVSAIKLFGLFLISPFILKDCYYYMIHFTTNDTLCEHKK